MSGIAGIIHFDGRPVEPGQIEAMTAAMHYRGPDGINHWRRGNVALGQCMLRTTPESLEETQPLTNEDESLVLVMDGRVDNFEELRRELLGRGAVLRTRADAELVLRAYEVWGDACPDRIIGECVFFIWDARQRHIFAARDAAGTRHFYYYQGRGWFAFASEIKGLLALTKVEQRLNESRLLDYLVVEFDRDDEISTFYEDILRMPAGHAMIGKDAGLRIWRYWDPSNLSEQKFTSLQECTDAFMDQLRVAVKCRLRSVKPVGALLSGGLDSSTIVGLVSKEFWGELREPLRTYSLILEDRENCADWRNIKAILQADSSLLPTIVTSAAVDGNWQLLLDSIPNADEPFGVVNGLTSNLVLQEVSASDCGVLLEGMAGDVLFYGASRTAVELLRQRRYDLIPGLLAGYRNHGYGGGLTDILGVFLRNLAPDFARASMRRRRDERQVGEGSMKILQADVARSYLASKRTPAFLSGERVKAVSDQIWHAQLLTTGLVSFAHEVGSTLALARGIEVRSPFSDRRMFEFAIKMPLEGKIFAPWYKYLLRKGASGMLPDSVRWRREIGGHPGWAFYERLGRNIARDAPEMCRVSSHNKKLARWVDVSRIGELWDRFESLDDAVSGQQAVRILLLSQWLSSHSF